MTEIVTEQTTVEFDAFVARHPKGHFMQTSLWGAQKPDWTWVAIARRDQFGAIIGGLSMLLRKVPKLPFTLMYCGRGPVCDPDDAETVDDLLHGAKQLARKFRSYAIKIDPDIPKGDDAFVALLEKHKFFLAGDGKNFEGAQPRFVFRLDVAGKTGEELLASFSSKTRYNIRLAARKGVEVRLANEEGLDDFAALMMETGLRDGFVTRPRSYFARMFQTMGEHARLYMAYFEGEPIAGTLAIHYGDKVWYLYGASSNRHRNLMPNYLLQWEMIQWSLELGCRVYDFRGVSGDLNPENPLYGLYRFKQGFNGAFTEFIGEFDYVESKLIYTAANKARQLMGRRAKRKYMKLKTMQEAAPSEQPGDSADRADDAE